MERKLFSAVQFFFAVLSGVLAQAPGLLAGGQPADASEAPIVGKIRAARGIVEMDGQGRVIGVTLVGSTEEQMEAIEFAALPRLDFLMILCPKLTDRSLVHLQEVPPTLKMLTITGAAFDEKHFGPLLRKQKSLEFLCLNGTGITDQTLAEIGGLGDLGCLCLRGTKITDKGLAKLAGLQKLIFLVLAQTQTSDAGLQELRKMPRLRMIDLSGTKITDAGIQRLEKMEYLHDLEVSGTKVTEKGKKALQNRLPDLRFDAP